jgi:hypothetical protein
LYTGIVDVRVIELNALPIAPLFDEFLIVSPIVNPNNVKPEFNPTKSPSKYKYQALKDFLFMLELEPFIGYGLINLIPDPSDFDLNLMKAMMGMARSHHADFVSERDRKFSTKLALEDYLNTIHMMPKVVRIQSLISDFGMSEDEAAQTIDTLEVDAESSPLTVLQSMQPDTGGQFMQFSMGPNYEMALFIAQVTGSVIVTDSESRWIQLRGAQHSNMGIVSYLLNDVYKRLNKLPMDYQMLESYVKTQGNFNIARTILKNADELVLCDLCSTEQLDKLTESVKRLDEKLMEFDPEPPTANFIVLAPEGGFYDRNVQRLLTLSGCLSYDHQVRAVYYFDKHSN